MHNGTAFPISAIFAKRLRLPYVGGQEPKRMAKIVVVGSLNMDVVAVASRIPMAGETIIGNKFFISPGGKGANQAYAAAKLAGSVAMLGRVGDDEFGHQMRENLASV